LFIADILQTRGGPEGIPQMHMSKLFVAKTKDFLKIMVCPHSQEGKG